MRELVLSLAEAAESRRWSPLYLRMLRDWRYTLYLLAIGVHSAVYVQYLSTLPLNIKAAGIAISWYTLAIALNGLIVIAFELLVTKVTQSWQPAGKAYLGSNVSDRRRPGPLGRCFRYTSIQSLGKSAHYRSCTL